MGRIAVERAFAAGQQLFVSDCPTCGVVFGVPERVVDQRREDGGSVYCPHGHTMVFTRGDSVEQREIKELKRKLDDERRRADSATSNMHWAQERAKGANISAGIARSKLAKTIQRVHAGVCPHCNRTFKQLAAHMKSKHSEACAK
jgi:uncharacterized Zn finger protein (UPF0148 family)